MDYKISFCTVCMNRLRHLQQTLPQNIEDNLDYPHVEFVVLDYNSQDGMESWILEEMKPYIDRGILTYLRVDEPPYFHRSHSRNVAFKHATGDIVVNIDADNYIGKGFAWYLNEQFSAEENMFIIPEDTPSDGAGSFGKVSLKKEDFLAIRGYDEQISGWGFEDVDFYTRLKAYGLQERHISDKTYLRCIEHGGLERVCNQKNYQNLYTLFGVFTREWAELIFLYKDGTFEWGTFLYNTSDQDNFGQGLLCVLKDNELRSGNWTYEDSYYEFAYDASSLHTRRMQYNQRGWTISTIQDGILNVYPTVLRTRLIHHALLLNEAAKNFRVFKASYDNQRVVVNTEFGIAEVRRVCREVVS